MRMIVLLLLLAGSKLATLSPPVFDDSENVAQGPVQEWLESVTYIYIPIGLPQGLLLPTSCTSHAVQHAERWEKDFTCLQASVHTSCYHQNQLRLVELSRLTVNRQIAIQPQWRRGDSWGRKAQDTLKCILG